MICLREKTVHPGIPAKGDAREASSVTVDPELRTWSYPISTPTVEFNIPFTAHSSRRLSARRLGFPSTPETPLAFHDIF